MQTKKQQEDQHLLEQFIKLRPIRAIDRMLSQHSLDKVYSLYGNLQEKIRKNTSDLRATLTDKYQNLVDCSNLLMSIQNFTHQIESIEKDISKIFRQDPLEDQFDDKNSKKSLVNRIEQYLYRKQFKKAMELSHQKEDGLEESQILYLPFMRMQILEGLETELIGRKINENFITQIISCLKKYIEGLSSVEREEVVGNAPEFEEGTILSLLSSILTVKKEVNEGDLLEVVFKCKLFSLSRSQRGITEQDRISKFFHDIHQLLGQKSRNSGQVDHLAAIFCQNWSQIETHLSETFIVTNQGQIISFRYDLYEKLLSSQNFMSILNALDSVIAASCEDGARVSLMESFLNLWNNYYQELLALLFARIDPTSKLPKIHQQEQGIPPELQKYFTSDIVIDDYLKSYRNDLALLLGNVRQLMGRSEHLGSKTLKKTDILGDIRSCYKSKISQINDKIKQCQKQLSSSINQNNLHALILLFFYCQEFGRAVDNQAKSSQLEQLAWHKLNWDKKIANSFSLLFYKQGRQSWSISFDRFFMNYNPCVLASSQTDIVKKIILALMEGMMMGLDSNRASVIIGEHSSKREREEQETKYSKGRLPDIPEGISAGDMFKKKSYLIK